MKRKHMHGVTDASYSVSVILYFFFQEKLYFVFVKDKGEKRRKRRHLLFKFPGGKGELIDEGDIISTAVREIQEELGLKLDRERLVYCHKDWNLIPTKIFYVSKISIREAISLKENEEITIFIKSKEFIENYPESIVDVHLHALLMGMKDIVKNEFGVMAA